MTMNGPALAALIVASQPPILDGTGLPNAAATAANLAYWTIIATAIVSYIQSNASVPVPALGLAAPSGGGPVTGAAVGTIT